MLLSIAKEWEFRAWKNMSVDNAGDLISKTLS